MLQDHYAALELEKNCTQEEIERAYKKLALRYHPDRNPGDSACAEKFMQIQAAYEVLRNTEKRSQYDNPPVPMMNPFFNHGDIFDTEDLNIRLMCSVTLPEAICGVIKTITISKKAPCDSCRGNGFTSFVTCGLCHGRGVAINAFNNFFKFQTVCGNCQGQGKIGSARCVGCGGNRYGKPQDTTISINIPKGIQTGMTLCVNGQGHTGVSGRVGSTYVECRLNDENKYKLSGLDIECNFHSKISTLIFGGVIEIPTLEDEKIEISVPANTKCGTKFRIKEKGLPDIRNNMARGDLVANILTEIPNLQSGHELHRILISHGL